MRADSIFEKCSRALHSIAPVVSCASVMTIFWIAQTSASEGLDPVQFINQQVQAHPGLSGSYVLERGEESLLARAWMADHARRTIEVQYFTSEYLLQRRCSEPRIAACASES